MKRELGIAKCGLACCLCVENEHCSGCDSCLDREACENWACCAGRGVGSCAACPEESCRKGLLGKLRPYAFTVFVRRHGVERLLDCLEENERRGIVYHREGLTGDYDGFENLEAILSFIENKSKT